MRTTLFFGGKLNRRSEDLIAYIIGLDLFLNSRRTVIREIRSRYPVEYYFVPFLRLYYLVVVDDSLKDSYIL